MIFLQHSGQLESISISVPPSHAQGAPLVVDQVMQSSLQYAHLDGNCPDHQELELINPDPQVSSMSNTS